MKRNILSVTKCGLSSDVATVAAEPSAMEGAAAMAIMAGSIAAAFVAAHAGVRAIDRKWPAADSAKK